MHEGFGCIGGKNGGTPNALKCLTSLFEAHTGHVQGKVVEIPSMAIVTARCSNEFERNSDCMNLRYWAVQSIIKLKTGIELSQNDISDKYNNNSWNVVEGS